MPTIVIADANELIRECITALINEIPDLTVIEQCPDGWRMMKTVEAEHPEIAIVATNLPDLEICNAAKMIRQISPATRTIALTRRRDELDVLDLDGSGISGEVHEDGTVRELVDMIRIAMLDSNPARISAAPQGRGKLESAANNHRHENLTQRECQVLKLIGEGLSSKQIASQLKISETTVKTYRNHLMDKLNVRDVAGLTRESVRLKLVHIDSC